MRILNRDAVAAALSYPDCINALEPAMKAVSNGGAIMPLRQYLDIPGGEGKFTTMPGYLEDPTCFGLKIVSKFPREPDSPHGSHVGAVMVFDPNEGIPLIMLDGAELTAIRTASASALATKFLARTDSKILTVLGTGTEALHHVRAILCVRDIDTVRIWGRTEVHAQHLSAALEKEVNVDVAVVSDIEEAVSGADIVCTTTATKEPILKGKWLTPGCHVNLVGAAVISAAEADVDVVTRSRFFVDSKTSAMAQAGELKAAMDAGLVNEDHIIAELGELAEQPKLGRLANVDITVYKSLGVAAQDLAAGLAAFESAESKNIGIEIDW